MSTVLTFQWPGHRAWKSVNEDAIYVNQRRGVFVVADGVTRRGFTGAYPNPSPAAEAARAIVEAAGTALSNHHQRLIPASVSNAMSRGNRAVQDLNQRLSLCDDHNYWDRDLAGAVAACLVLRPHHFLYGFIGDCGLAHFDVTGKLFWHTPDMLEPIIKQGLIPPIEEIGEKQRFIIVRRDLRNKPRAPHPTYGVFTGEKAALDYVQAARRGYDPGDILAVYSDGAAPFVTADPEFGLLLALGEEKDIQAYVAQRSSPKQHNDEKTLIIVRT